MANKIGGKAIVTTGGADSMTWLAQHLLPGTFIGDEPLIVLDDGHLKTIPRHQACLVFPASTFKSVGTYKDFSKATDRPRELETGWTATPFGVVPFLKNFSRSVPPFEAANVAAFHAMNAAAVAAGGSVFVKPNDVLIPLGDPCPPPPAVVAVACGGAGSGGASSSGASSSSDLHKKAEVLLQQVARQWVSGATNKADMSNKHVWTTYMTAIHCTAFTVMSGLETDAAPTGVVPLWTPLVCLVRTFALLHQQYETFRKDTDHLSGDFGARDMTQMALARRFAGKPWDRETQWSVLRVMIGRGKTKQSNADGSVIHANPNVSTMPGILNIYVLLPLLQRFIETCSAPLDMGMVTASKSMLVSRFRELKAAFGAKCNPIDALVILSTYTSEGSAVTKAHAGGFFKACMENEVSTPVDLVALGIVAPSSIKLGFETLPTTYVTVKAKGRADVRTSSTVKVVPLSCNQARIQHDVGSDTTFWAGVGLPTYGRYICEFTELGSTETVVGDMRGKDGVAAYRLTLGPDALPSVYKVEGISSAGVHHVNLSPYNALSTKDDNWTYKQKSADQIPGLAPFVIEYWGRRRSAASEHFDYFVTLKSAATGQVYADINTRDETPRLCFKNGKITMRFEPPPPEVLAAEAAAKAALVAALEEEARKAEAVAKEPVYTSYAAAMAAFEAAAATAAAAKGTPESKEGK